MTAGHLPIFALLALCLSIHAASGQDTTNRQADALKGFLAGKEAAHMQQYQALLNTGRRTDYQRLISCLRHSAVPMPSYPGATTSQAKKLVESFKLDIVGLILSTGASYSIQCSGADQNWDVVNQAAARSLRASASIEDLVRFSDTIATVRAVDSGRSDVVDGYRSGAAFVVMDPIKGDFHRGAKFTLRQESGRLPNGDLLLRSGEQTAKYGQPYLAMVSRSLYSFHVAERGLNLSTRDSDEHGVAAYGGLERLSKSGATEKWGSNTVARIRALVSAQAGNSRRVARTH